MKKLMRHTLLLIFVMFSFVLTSTVHAMDNSSGACGENATYSYDGAGTLTISGTGEISISPWDAEMTDYDIHTIVIQPGITSIGEGAFSSCINLKNVVIPDTVTSIGNSAFSNCLNLENITIPNSVTELGNSVFYLCKKLSSVTLGNSINSIGESAFYKCTSLTNIVIPESVTSIGRSAFQECNSLVQITIPDSVDYMGAYAFYYCENLSSVTIKNGLSDIGESSFEACKKLTKVTLPNTVTTISGWAFVNCSSLTNINLPDNLESIGEGAFSRCIKLKNIEFPASITTIDADAFSACPDLNSIYFLGNAPTIGRDAFYNVNATVYYPCNNDTWTADVRESFGSTLHWEALNYQLKSPVIRTSSRASDGKPVVTWDSVNGAAKYKVYSSTDKVNWKRLTTTRTNKLNNTSATTGNYYYYYVVALDADGNPSRRSNIAGRTCDLPQPKVTATNVASTGKIRISWKPVSGAVKYQVYRSASKNGTYTRIFTTTGTRMTNTSVGSGKAYYYKVKAIHSNSAANSAFSNRVFRTCDLPQPKIKVQLNNSGKPVVTWNSVNGAVNYQVYRSTSKNGTYTKLLTTSKTKVTNNSTKSGKTYYYKVRAVASKSAANSAFSSIVSIKSK